MQERDKKILMRCSSLVKVLGEDFPVARTGPMLQMQSDKELTRTSLTPGAPPRRSDCITRLTRAPIWQTGARSFCLQSSRGAALRYHLRGSPLFISGSCNRIRGQSSGQLSVGCSSAKDDRPTDGDDSSLFTASRRLNLSFVGSLLRMMMHPWKKMKDLKIPGGREGSSRARFDSEA